MRRKRSSTMQSEVQEEERKKQRRWADAEERALLAAWINNADQLRTQKRTFKVYKDIQGFLESNHFEFTIQEIQFKIHNLKTKYKKEHNFVKLGNDPHWEHYHIIHKIMNTVEDNMNEPEESLDESLTIDDDDFESQLVNGLNNDAEGNMIIPDNDITIAVDKNNSTSSDIDMFNGVDGMSLHRQRGIFEKGVDTESYEESIPAPLWPAAGGDRQRMKKSKTTPEQSKTPDFEKKILEAFDKLSHDMTVRHNETKMMNERMYQLELRKTEMMDEMKTAFLKYLSMQGKG